ncbi:hypothetical protein G3O00_36610 [Burkholderia sp. Ac-20384]|uniref:hypothetical protein n=1 Tax=Burkholderia sp. Ac-20384 TaxID=2703902 RepID=UPI00197EEAA4|nr:hypothetical protein [Burkholderia sp. Ac-20384]MBN3829086.1 hypothetical protein [Burkholderia sp. Ac-20384]
MSFIGKVFDEVFNGFKDSVGDVVHGIGDVGKGVGKLTMSIAARDGKGAIEGLKDVGKGGMDAISAGQDLMEAATPEGAAVNVMLAGAKVGIEQLSGKSTTAENPESTTNQAGSASSANPEGASRPKAS